MNKLKKKYTGPGLVEKLIGNHTKSYQGGNDLAKLCKKEMASVADMQTVAKKDTEAESSMNSFQLSRLSKAMSPERSRFEVSMDVFRNHLSNFVQLSPQTFIDLSSRIQSDIDHEIWDVKYQLTEGMKNFEKRKFALKHNPDGPSLKESARKRAIEVLEMRKPQIKKRKGVALTGEYKTFAQKFGLKEGLTMKLYDESAKKLEDKLKLKVEESLQTNRLIASKFISPRETSTETSSKWRIQRKKSLTLQKKIAPPSGKKHESSLKQYMSSGDVYFKDYIEDAAPAEYKGRLQNLQSLISAFHEEEGPDSRQLLNKACSVGRKYKKIRDMTRINLDTLITPQRYYKEFKRLVDKEENQTRATLLKNRVRRASLNSKILKAIT